MSENNQPSSYGTRRFGFEQLFIVAIVLVAAGIIGVLLWLAGVAG